MLIQKAVPRMFRRDTPGVNSYPWAGPRDISGPRLQTHFQIQTGTRKEKRKHMLKFTVLRTKKDNVHTFKVTGVHRERKRGAPCSPPRPKMYVLPPFQKKVPLHLK